MEKALSPSGARYSRERGKRVGGGAAPIGHGAVYWLAQFFFLVLKFSQVRIKHPTADFRFLP